MNEPYNVDFPTPPTGDHMPTNSANQQYNNPPQPNSPNLNNYQNNNSSPRTPYQGGMSVRCPRCGNVINTRFCSFCGMDLSKVYFVYMGTVYPLNSQIPGYNQPFNPQNPVYQTAAFGRYQSEKPHKHKTALLIILLSLLFIAVFVISGLFFNKIIFNIPPIDQDGGFPPTSNTEYYHPEGVSLEEYQQLKLNMPYATISAIIGGDGQIITQGEDVQGQPYIIYGWPGEDHEYVSVFITFTNDKVTEITNEGLTNE